MQPAAVSASNDRAHWTSRLALPCALAAALLLAVGCSSRSLNKPPVEDRGMGMTRPVPSDVVKPLPGAENAGKPGYYMVKPGDTMIRIGLENGQNWHDIARWNALENPNLIEVGQVLRVVPPGSDNGQARPVTPGSVAAVRPGATAPNGVPPPLASGSDEDVGWIWPAQGALVAGFDEAKNKGLDISGILKHNNTFLTAYAHNKTLLVKEDQTVKKGQKIAEMGNSDSEKVKLHFEIRRQGKPVDPAKYLPAR